MERDDDIQKKVDEILHAGNAQQLPGWGFARKILPVFELVRALFSQNRVNTVLKLMLLFELTQVRGRFHRRRIRSAMPYLDNDEIDRLVDSLYNGGWLELRASDNTYELSSAGTLLLATLHAADFENLSPENVLSRAAQNAEFGARLDGAEETTGYLLEQLLAELQRQVDEAKNVLQKGRPFRLIQWSRRNHHRQLTIIRGVLNSLEESLDDSSEEFRRTVEIHQKMQSIVRLQTGINDRLRQWNVEQLYTSGAGYSIPQLVEAVLGIDEATLEETVDQHLLQVPRLPPTLTTPEIRARFHAARRSLPSQTESFEYTSPDRPDPEPWNASPLDNAAELRRRLTDLLAGRDVESAPLTPDQWLQSTRLSGMAFELAMLSRLEDDDGHLELDDGRTARVSTPLSQVAGLAPHELIDHLRRRDILVRRAGGWVCRITIKIVEHQRNSHG